MNRKYWKTAAALAATLALSACGGGSDGPPRVVFPQDLRSVPASAGADLSSSNFVGVSTPAVSAVVASLGGSSSLLEVSLSARRSASSAGLDSTYRLTQTLARRGVARAQSQLDATSAREQPQVSQTVSAACSFGGSMTVSVNDADGNNDLSAGDTATFSFSNCIELSGDPAVSGSFTMGFNAVELDTARNPTAFDVSIAFVALTTQGEGSLNGGARLWLVPVTGGEHTLLRYSDLQANLGNATATLNFDVEEIVTSGSFALDINGGLTLAGQTYRLAQLQSYVGVVGDWPSGGTLRMLDAQNDAVNIVAHGTLVDLDFYLAGSGVPAAVLRNQPWSSF